MLCLVPSDLGC
uniref:CD45-AP (LSM-1) n=1 Tax=Mus musculus TaxID=10090 RepID=P97330_MOUSE|nr:CD45-AP (LSM-1) [Mus musculus]